MNSTLYASFFNISDAESAAKALKRLGIAPKAISIVAIEANQNDSDAYAVMPDLYDEDSEWIADEEQFVAERRRLYDEARVGLLIGGAFGLAIGIVASVCALYSPSLGWMLDRESIDTALFGTLAVLGVGASLGAVLGYYYSQEKETDDGLGDGLGEGEAILCLNIDLSAEHPEVKSVLEEHNAVCVSSGISAYLS